MDRETKGEPVALPALAPATDRAKAAKGTIASSHGARLARAATHLLLKRWRIFAIAGAATATLSVIAWAAVPSTTSGERCSGRKSCARDCDRKDLRACMKLAALERTTDEGARELPKAESALMAACDGGEPEGCLSLAWLYEDVAPGSLGGGEIERAPEFRRRAAAGLEKACETGNARSCLVLGAVHATGKGVEKSSRRALALYEKAKPLLEQECEANSARACVSLAAVYGSGLGILKDSARSYQLLEKACTLGDVAACVAAGSLFAEGQLAYPWQSALPKEPARAAACFRQACAANDMRSCHALAKVLRDNPAASPTAPSPTATTKDNPLSSVVTLEQRACEAGVASACAQLGRIYFSGDGVERDAKEADRFYQREVELRKMKCDAGSGEDCDLLGQNYKKNGTGVSIDPARAKELYERTLVERQKGCDAGIAEECRVLRVLLEHEMKPDEVRTRTLRDRECTLGIEEACRRQGKAPPFPRP